jgi:hypothetical protein
MDILDDKPVAGEVEIAMGWRGTANFGVWRA